jgi:hypothetical protein
MKDKREFCKVRLDENVRLRYERKCLRQRGQSAWHLFAT